jgi:hypothetical protein
VREFVWHNLTERLGLDEVFFSFFKPTEKQLSGCVLVWTKSGQKQKQKQKIDFY